MNESRLSELNIEDAIIRASFYNRIQRYLSNPANNAELIKYTIKIDEKFRPDLISYRIYHDQNLDWLVALVCGIDDYRMPFPVGELIAVPSASWVRRNMREFMTEAGL